MRRSTWTYVTASALLISLDQGSKYYLQDSRNAFVNEKGFFLPAMPPGLIIIASLVIVTILSHILFKKNTPLAITAGLTFLLSGGIGNLIDRIIYGYVQDIIAIYTAIFNLADIYIVIGTIFLLWGVYASESKDKSLEA